MPAFEAIEAFPVTVQNGGIFLTVDWYIRFRKSPVAATALSEILRRITWQSQITTYASAFEPA